MTNDEAVARMWWDAMLTGHGLLRLDGKGGKEWIDIRRALVTGNKPLGRDFEKVWDDNSAKLYVD